MNATPFIYNPDQPKSRTAIYKILATAQISAKNNRKYGDPIKSVVLHGVLFKPFLMHQVFARPGPYFTPYLAYNLGDGDLCARADELAHFLSHKLSQ